MVPSISSRKSFFSPSATAIASSPNCSHCTTDPAACPRRPCKIPVKGRETGRAALPKEPPRPFHRLSSIVALLRQELVGQLLQGRPVRLLHRSLDGVDHVDHAV